MKTMTRSLPSTSTYDSTHHRVQPCSFLARPYEPDDFIHADAAAGRHRQPAHHGMLKVVLGPRAPDDAPDVELVQVVKIHLRLVEEHTSTLCSPAQTSRARLLACSPAVSTMAQAGVNQHAGSPWKTTPAGVSFNCRQGSITIDAAQSPSSSSHPTCWFMAIEVIKEVVHRRLSAPAPRAGRAS